MPRTLKFAINRMSAPRLPFTEFAAMAQRLGVGAIEIRNDLPGVEMNDGQPAACIKSIASDHALAIRSINALQRFEQYNAGREREARALAGYARDCGAQALVLCPTNSRQDSRDAGQRHADLVAALTQLRPILQEHGLVGLVEPLGFEECALRRKSQAARAMLELGDTSTFGLVHDTFHHHLAGEDLMFTDLTGLVHVSGVADPTLDVSQMRDPHRVLVDGADRLGNTTQLRRLLDAGYAGFISFEPFAEEIAAAPDIERRLAASMDYLRATV
jgi:2-keto-myo-inositol isomerase